MATNATVTTGPTKGTSCQLPDLGYLFDKVSLTYMLNRCFCGGGPKDPISHARIVNFIRIIDAAVEDYRNMRFTLEQYLSTPNDSISPLFFAINYAEHCIGNLHRAIRLADAIRRDQHGPHVHKTELLSSLATKTVREFRDEIQHLDEMLTNGTWNPSDTHSMMLYDDRLQVYGKTILYRDLAQWITKLHSLSEKLAQYQQP